MPQEMLKESEALRSDKVCASVVPKLNDIFREMNVSPHSIQKLQMGASPDGSFGISCLLEDGSPLYYSGSASQGRVSGSVQEFLPKFAQTYEFSMAGPKDRGGVKSQFNAYVETYASEAANGPLVATFPRTEGRQIQYSVDDEGSVSGGKPVATVLGKPLDSKDVPKEGENGVGIAVPEAENIAPGDANSTLELVRSARSGPKAGFGGAEFGKDEIFLPADKPHSPGHTSDLVSIEPQPLAGYVLRPMQQKVQFYYDVSATSLGSEDDIRRQIKDAKKSVLDGVGGTFSSKMLPDDRDTNLANYALIDNNLHAFNDYFRKIYTGEGVDAYLQNKRDYQDGKTSDNDGYRSAIYRFMEDYEKGKATALVLMGDGGNQYRRLSYEPDAKDGKPWKWETDLEKVMADRRALEQFHAKFPDARIHYVGQKIEVDSESSPLDPPGDYEFIKDLAERSGGQAYEYSQNLDFSKIIKAEEPAVLLPARQPILMSIEPESRKPFLSVDLGSKIYTPLQRPGWLFTKPFATKADYEYSLWDMLNRPGSMPPTPLDEWYKRRIITAPNFYGALFPLLGYKDLLGKEVGFSEFLDKYRGVDVASGYAQDALRLLPSGGAINSADSKAQADLINSFFAANREKMYSDVWDNIGAGEFDKFGERGRALRGFTDYMARVRFYDVVLSGLEPGTGLYNLIKKERDEAAKPGFEYTWHALTGGERWLSSLYIASAAQVLESLVSGTAKGSAYVRMAYNAGDSGIRLDYGQKEPIPAMSFSFNMLRNPFLQLPDESAFWAQFYDMTSASVHAVFSGAACSSKEFELSYRLNAGLGLLVPDSDQSRLRLASASIEGNQYAGTWPVSKTLPIFFAGAEANCIYRPQDSSFEGFLGVKLVPVSGRMITEALGHGSGLADEGGRKIAPELDSMMMPLYTDAKLRWWAFRSQQEISSLLFEGIFDGLVAEQKYVPRRIGLEATYRVGDQNPFTAKLSGFRAGMTGPNSWLVGAQVSQELLDRKLTLSLEGHWQKYGKPATISPGAIYFGINYKLY